MERNKYDVFISYSSKNQKVVEAMCAYLEQHKVRCFVAYRDIPKGVVWAKAIVEALDESKMMVVVFSEEFNLSDQVDREIELASEDKKPILTFRISNTMFKGAKKYYLKNINWIDAFPNPENLFDSLLNNVNKLIGTSTLEKEVRKTEQKHIEQERLERERKEAATREKAEQERLERERREAEQKRLEQERIEREKREAEAKIKAEQERLERERREAEQKRLEQERIEREKRETEAKRKNAEIQKSTSNMANGHEYVDLGLPSGLKWATCNVGANKPEDYGDYFAWGEVNTKSEYSPKKYKFGFLMTGFLNLITIGGIKKYDAARYNWGGKWRIPTKAELQELCDKCTWSLMSQNGVEGYKVTGPNGNSIFLPAAGGRYGSSLGNAGSYGLYWSSTPLDNNDYNAYDLTFDSGSHGTYSNFRDDGRSVRPVLE